MNLDLFPLYVSPEKANAYVVLCKLAVEEEWCGRVGCTTCYCCHMRYGLLELSRGKHPDDKGGVVNASRLRYPGMSGFPARLDAAASDWLVLICLAAPRDELMTLVGCQQLEEYLGLLRWMVHEPCEGRKAVSEWISECSAGSY